MNIAENERKTVRRVNSSDLNGDTSKEPPAAFGLAQNRNRFSTDRLTQWRAAAVTYIHLFGLGHWPSKLAPRVINSRELHNVTHIRAVDRDGIGF